MKLKLKQLVEASQALSRISSEKTSGKLAYCIAKNLHILTPELEIYDKAVNSLVEEFRIFENGEYRIPKGKEKELQKRIEEIQSEELELDIHKFDWPESKEISGADLFVLDWMINIKEPEDKLE